MKKFDFHSNASKFNLKNALRLAEASELAYCKSQAKIKKQVIDKWGFADCKVIENKDTELFIASSDDVIVIAFRGTDSIKDWITDIKARKVRGSFGYVHRGFSKALEYVWDDIVSTLKKVLTNSQPIWITGHSLGGALATLVMAQLLQKKHIETKGLYTFGQPRVGTVTFARNFNALFKHRSFRIVNNEDIVTRVPPRAANYDHIGKDVYFDNDGKIHRDARWGKRLLDRYMSSTERAMNRYYELKKDCPNSLEDHSLKLYIKIIKKNLPVKKQPFLDFDSYINK